MTGFGKEKWGAACRIFPHQFSFLNCSWNCSLQYYLLSVQVFVIWPTLIDKRCGNAIFLLVVLLLQIKLDSVTKIKENMTLGQSSAGNLCHVWENVNWESGENCLISFLLAWPEFLSYKCLIIFQSNRSDFLENYVNQSNKIAS